MTDDAPEGEACPADGCVGKLEMVNVEYTPLAYIYVCAACGYKETR